MNPAPPVMHALRIAIMWFAASDGEVPVDRGERSVLRPSISELVAGRFGVPIEHLHRFEGELTEVLAEPVQLA